MSKAFTLTALIALAIATSFAAQPRKGVAPKVSPQHFGSCCKDLSAAMKVQNSLFRVETNGVLYLSVGFVETPQGPGFFDQAVLYCPFCGKQIQSKAEIAARSKA